MNRYYLSAAAAAVPAPAAAISDSSSTSNCSRSSSFLISSSEHIRTTQFRLNHHWKIDQFGAYRRHFPQGKTLTATPFFASEHDLRFDVQICPAGDNSAPGACRRLDRFNNLPPDVLFTTSPIRGGSAYWLEGSFVMLDVEVGVIKSEEQTKQMVWLTKYRQQMTPISKKSHFTANRFSFDLKREHLGADGSLELVFDVVGHYTSTHFSGVVPFRQKEKNFILGNGYAQTMKNYLETSTDSDVTLVAAGSGGDNQQRQQFKAHQQILSIHSEVFAAYFRHQNTREAVEKKVHIEDVSSEAVRTLLEYIYTGTVENMDDLTLELLVAAEKYQVDALKEACERQLLLKMTTESVFPILQHADFYHAPSLKENCIKFIIFKHGAGLMSLNTSTAWKSFTESAPVELIIEVLFRVNDA